MPNVSIREVGDSAVFLHSWSVVNRSTKRTPSIQGGLLPALILGAFAAIAATPAWGGVESSELDLAPAAGLEPNPAVTIVVVCAVRILREALSELLNGTLSLSVVGSAESLDDALIEIHRTRPDVALVDSTNGIVAIREIARLEPACKVVVLGLSETDEDDVVPWIEAGAAGCVTPRDSLDSALRAVVGVAEGKAFFSPCVAGRVASRLRELGATHRLDGDDRGLTHRETEVLTLIERGLSNKEIAQHLWISTATVKNHVHSILQKLHLQRRAEARAWLRRQMRLDSRHELV
jgi:DNA-binding NarL/FixJ family response regulator